jgi:hypothetical protein
MRFFTIRHWDIAYDLSGYNPQLDGYKEDERELDRWNKGNDPCIYMYDSLPLCIYEHYIRTSLTKLPPALICLELEVPDGSCEVFGVDALPPDWRNESQRGALQQFGSSILRAKRTLVAGFPSFEVPGEKNYLLNPKHELIGEVKFIGVRKCNY